MDKIKKIISIFLLIVFVGYYGNVTLFSHTHIINGVTIVHSHIHKNSHHDTQSGGHTEHNITLIAQISHIDYVDFSCNCALNSPQLCMDIEHCVPTIEWVTSLHLQNLSLRAPPVAV